MVEGTTSSLSVIFKSGTFTCVVLPGLNCDASVLSSATGFLLIPKLISEIFSLNTSTAIIPSALPSNPTRPMFSPSALFQLTGSCAVLLFKTSVKTSV